MLNVSLTPAAQTFIQEQLDRGKYGSIDEILLAGLELLAAKDAADKSRYEELRRDIEIGLAEANRGELIDGEELFERLRQKSQQRRTNYND
jgi:antitoxin ParD1/3/4